MSDFRSPRGIVEAMAAASHGAKRGRGKRVPIHAAGREPN